MDQLLDTTTNKDAYIIPPYARDIRLLILTFLQRRSLDLMTFKKTWIQLGFSQIWNAKPDDVDKRIYAKEIFNCVLSYFLVPSHTFPVKLAALYAMYFLYETQPGTNEKKTKIPMIPHVFYELLKIREIVKERSIHDAYHCMNRLTILKAYLYTMSTNIDLVIGCIDPPKYLVPNVSHLNEALKKEWQWKDFSDMIRKEEEYLKKKKELITLSKQHSVDTNNDNNDSNDNNDNNGNNENNGNNDYDIENDNVRNNNINFTVSKVLPNVHNVNRNNNNRENIRENNRESSGVDESSVNNPFFRVTPHFFNNINQEVINYLKNRNDEWSILLYESLLQSKESNYLSIEQQSLNIQDRRDDEHSGDLDRTERIVRIFRPEKVKSESDSDSDDSSNHPRKRIRYT